jgi:ATP-binding cassette, subfamily B, bacterial PglK
MKKLFKRLWLHIDVKRRLQFFILFIVMIFSAASEVISIGAVIPFLAVMTNPEKVFFNESFQSIVEFFAFTQPQELILPLTMVFIFAAILSGLMRFILIFIQTKLSYAIGADFSISIYRRTLYQPYSVHVSRNSSEIISGISSKASAVAQSTLMPLLTMLSSCIMLLSIMFALAYIDFKIALFGFVGFSSCYFFLILISKSRLKKDSNKISIESVQVIKALQEGLGGIRDILIDGTQSVYCKIFRDADLPLRAAKANIQIISASPRFLIEAIGIIVIAILAYNLSQQPDGFSDAIPTLGAFALGAQRLLPALQQIYSNWSFVRGGEASLCDALDLLDQKMPSYLYLPEKKIYFKEKIAFKNLSFSYLNNSINELSNINLEILKGEMIGIRGSTGAGKSTFLDILMGLLIPSSGKLEIDGIEITNKNFRQWQSNIAHVPQNIFLSDSSIAENIAFGVPLNEINLGKVKKVAEHAQISSTIDSMENGYETIVGEDGVRLSGGQRQRIGIARALYKDAHVLIFDEGTSALDNETENLVMESIERLKKDITIIMVAHRLSTLKNCSKIIKLVDGKINDIEFQRSLDA